MKRNVGTLDRWIRFLLGGFLVSLVFWGPQSNWGWLGLVLMGTSVVSRCPIYALLGWRTCPARRED